MTVPPAVVGPARDAFSDAINKSKQKAREYFARNPDKAPPTYTSFVTDPETGGRTYYKGGKEVDPQTGREIPPASRENPRLIGYSGDAAVYDYGDGNNTQTTYAKIKRPDKPDESTAGKTYFNPRTWRWEPTRAERARRAAEPVTRDNPRIVGYVGDAPIYDYGDGRQYIHTQPTQEQQQAYEKALAEYNRKEATWAAQQAEYYGKLEEAGITPEEAERLDPLRLGFAIQYRKAEKEGKDVSTGLWGLWGGKDISKVPTYGQIETKRGQLQDEFAAWAAPQRERLGAATFETRVQTYERHLERSQQRGVTPDTWEEFIGKFEPPAARPVQGPPAPAGIGKTGAEKMATQIYGELYGSKSNKKTRVIKVSDDVKIRRLPDGTVQTFGGMTYNAKTRTEGTIPAVTLGKITDPGIEAKIAHAIDFRTRKDAEAKISKYDEIRRSEYDAAARYGMLFGPALQEQGLIEAPRQNFDDLFGFRADQKTVERTTRGAGRYKSGPARFGDTAKFDWIIDGGKFLTPITDTFAQIYNETYQRGEYGKLPLYGTVLGSTTDRAFDGLAQAASGGGFDKLFSTGAVFQEAIKKDPIGAAAQIPLELALFWTGGKAATFAARQAARYVPGAILGHRIVGSQFVKLTPKEQAKRAADVRKELERRARSEINSGITRKSIDETISQLPNVVEKATTAGRIYTFGNMILGARRGTSFVRGEKAAQGSPDYLQLRTLGETAISTQQPSQALVKLARKDGFLDEFMRQTGAKRDTALMYRRSLLAGDVVKDAMRHIPKPKTVGNVKLRSTKSAIHDALGSRIFDRMASEGIKYAETGSRVQYVWVKKFRKHTPGPGDRDGMILTKDAGARVKKIIAEEVDIFNRAHPTQRVKQQDLAIIRRMEDYKDDGTSPYILDLHDEVPEAYGYFDKRRFGAKSIYKGSVQVEGKTAKVQKQTWTIPEEIDAGQAESGLLLRPIEKAGKAPRTVMGVNHRTIKDLTKRVAFLRGLADEVKTKDPKTAARATEQANEFVELTRRIHGVDISDTKALRNYSYSNFEFLTLGRAGAVIAADTAKGAGLGGAVQVVPGTGKGGNIKETHLRRNKQGLVTGVKVNDKTWVDITPAEVDNIFRRLPARAEKTSDTSDAVTLGYEQFSRELRKRTASQERNEAPARQSMFGDFQFGGKRGKSNPGSRPSGPSQALDDLASLGSRTSPSQRSGKSSPRGSRASGGSILGSITSSVAATDYSPGSRPSQPTSSKPSSPSRPSGSKASQPSLFRSRPSRSTPSRPSRPSKVPSGPRSPPPSRIPVSRYPPPIRPSRPIGIIPKKPVGPIIPIDDDKKKRKQKGRQIKGVEFSLGVFRDTFVGYDKTRQEIAYGKDIKEQRLSSSVGRKKPRRSHDDPNRGIPRTSRRAESKKSKKRRAKGKARDRGIPRFI